VPPDQLLSALLLQLSYGIYSERKLMEQPDYNLLYRWFVGLSPDEAVWMMLVILTGGIDPSVGSVLALCTVVGAEIMTNGNIPLESRYLWRSLLA
jgi:predicted ABC-type sugar transport system permease subunit